MPIGVSREEFRAHLARALDLSKRDRIVGFLYLGTAARAPNALTEAASEELVRRL